MFYNVKRKACILSSLISLFWLGAANGQGPQNRRDAAHPAGEKPWSVRMADSEMTRLGDSIACEKTKDAKWRYETGVILKGIDGVWKKTGDARYGNYVRSIMDSYIETDGTIKTYRMDEYNLDQINQGKMLLRLYEEFHQEKYRKAADLLMQQLATHPRTKEGGFWHKKIYPWQMWLDGIYMQGPFYSSYCSLFANPKGFDDVAHQILLIEKHTRDAKTGLFYHGWDESREQKWADPKTGCSPNFWGRAMGWYAMALADVLDSFPADHPQRARILSIFVDLCGAALRYQDEETGLWYQVVDQGKREGNYLEASASSMFVYALAKGAGKGYLGKELATAARKGHEGIVRQLIKIGDGGQIELTQICKVAGLGGNPYRDGSYQYYVGEPKAVNDPKGTGPFIMASLEVEALASKK
jgi:unsaturated rhamnogalacturonyl hydrolase